MSKPTGYDFCGYATRNDVLCTDGRTIKKDAFAHQDGARVPLVWQHMHDSPSNIIGHGILENRADGVYVYGYLNKTGPAKDAAELLRHGDIDSLSIFAQKLKQKAMDVYHGVIREVSLVLAGANEGAYIENVSIKHGDGTYSELEEDAVFELHENLSHADGALFTKAGLKKDDEKKIEGDEEKVAADGEDDPAEKTATEEDKKKAAAQAKDIKDKGDQMKHADGQNETVADVIATLNEKQMNAVEFLIGQALEGGTAKHSDDGDNEDEELEHMNKNAFDRNKSAELTHREVNLSEDDFAQLVSYAKTSGGSLKEAFIQHAADYGIENIDLLFPDAQNVTNEPITLSREMGWVPKVMNGVRRTPFSRLKSLFIDITADEARARGYVKGTKKVEEVIVALKRVTTPVTIYKLQKLDRDDIIDIIDMDIIAWIKKEMRVMLEEEIARAVLVGDGRAVDADGKIPEANVRPIWTDDSVYVYRAQLAADATADEVIDETLRSYKNYRGSGAPMLFATVDFVADMLLLKDTTGRRLYNTEADVAATLRVSSIVTVPVMEGLQRTETTGPNAGKKFDILGIIVNLRDYTIGADKGGAVSMFEDFDIDYNQHKYLIETRISGALTVPESAIVLERESA